MFAELPRTNIAESSKLLIQPRETIGMEDWLKRIVLNAQIPWSWYLWNDALAGEQTAVIGETTETEKLWMTGRTGQIRNKSSSDSRLPWEDNSQRNGVALTWSPHRLRRSILFGSWEYIDQPSFQAVKFMAQIEQSLNNDCLNQFKANQLQLQRWITQISLRFV